MDYRLKFMLWLYDWSQVVYAKVFKRNKEAWGISKSELLLFPEGTLGKALGEFYQTKGFDVMPKLENHDVFHILTKTGTEIQDEIAMQYLLFGNGKRSLYMFSMMGIGTVLYPEFIQYYLKTYQKGKTLSRFHDTEFKYLLDNSLLYLRISIQSSHNLFI